MGDGRSLEEAAHWYGGLETVILTDTLPVPELPPDTAVYQVPADVMESLSPMKTPSGGLVSLPPAAACSPGPDSRLPDFGRHSGPGEPRHHFADRRRFGGACGSHPGLCRPL